MLTVSVAAMLAVNMDPRGMRHEPPWYESQMLRAAIVSRPSNGVAFSLTAWGSARLSWASQKTYRELAFPARRVLVLITLIVDF